MNIHTQFNNSIQSVFAALIMLMLTFGFCLEAYCQPTNTKGQIAPSGGGTGAKIDSVTVEFGATQTNMYQSLPDVGNQNWGCVKAPGSHILVRAITSPDNEVTWNKIVWNGGQKANASGNNYRLYSRDAATQFQVKPLLGGSGPKQLNIWVMWVEISIKTSGTTPPNAVQFGENYDATEILGARSYAGGTIARGKIVAVGQITPKDARRVAFLGWDFRRQLLATAFKDGVKFDYLGKGADWDPDNSNFSWKKLFPDSDGKIYDTDAPNIGNFKGLATSCVEVYYNFRQYVVWSGNIASDRNPYPSSVKWHWSGKWQNGGIPEKVVDKQVGGGHITLPSVSQGCP